MMEGLPSPDGFTPGVYLDVDAGAYHRYPAVAASDLHLVNRSPLHYAHAQEHPEPPTPQMRFGTAVHTAVLEPDAWPDRYVVGDFASTRSKAYAEWAAEVEGANKEPILREDQDRVFAIADALMAHPLASTYLFEVDGPTEASVLWERDVFVNHHVGSVDVRCKCRPDKLPIGFDAVVDLKTSYNASPTSWPHDVIRYRYHVGAAWYLAGMRAVGTAVDTYLFIVVESRAPFAIGCYTLPDELVEHAEMLIEVNLHRYALCREHDAWPSYAENIVELQFGPYAYRDAA